MQKVPFLSCCSLPILQNLTESASSIFELLDYFNQHCLVLVLEIRNAGSCLSSMGEYISNNNGPDNMGCLIPIIDDDAVAYPIIKSLPLGSD